MNVCCDNCGKSVPEEKSIKYEDQEEKRVKHFCSDQCFAEWGSRLISRLRRNVDNRHLLFA